MVQTGINKLPPRSVTFFARRESKDPSPTDIFGPDNKKFRVILDYGKDFMRSADRTTADAKKLKQALGLNDSQWYETTLQIFRGSAEINCKSILANEFASDKNNRTEAKYDEFLCDILTKTYGVPYLGDCMVNFIWRGNIKMEQGPEGPYIELNTFRASFTVYWSVATGPYTKRRHTYDHNKMMECIFACLPRRYQAAIDSSPTVDIYNENKEEEMWTLLDGEREKDIANGVLERIHKQQQQQKAAAAAERKAQAAKAKKRAEEKARGDRGRQGFRRPRHHANNSFPSKNGKHSNQHYGPSKRDNNYKPSRPEKSHDDRAPRKDDRNNNCRRDYSKSSAYHNADDSLQTTVPTMTAVTTTAMKNATMIITTSVMTIAAARASTRTTTTPQNMTAAATAPTATTTTVAHLTVASAHARLNAAASLNAAVPARPRRNRESRAGETARLLIKMSSV